MFLLSLFPGIDLLARGFEAEGYYVVRGPDILWGSDITDFHAPAAKFDGVIGGSPCQDFSGARRSAPTGNGERMLVEFARLITETVPKWFLLENVPRCPDIQIEGYGIQRIDLTASDCGSNQRRLRHFQFGHRDKLVISVPRVPSGVSLKRICLATEGENKHRRTWSEFCQLQGLPADFELPGWSLEAKYRAVGNGVPIPVARVLARAIRTAKPLDDHEKLCLCGCGRIIDLPVRRGPVRVLATDSCKKRMQKRREKLVTKIKQSAIDDSPITPAESPVSGEQVA